MAYAVEMHDIEQGKLPKDDVTQLAHYNARDNHCYVGLSLHGTGEPPKYAMREIYDGQTGELLASYNMKTPPLGEATGIIFRIDRVPVSALPPPLDVGKDHSNKDRRENEADRAQAYIVYLMEGN